MQGNECSVHTLLCQVPDITYRTHGFSGALGRISLPPYVALEKMRENSWKGKNKKQEMTRTCK